MSATNFNSYFHRIQLAMKQDKPKEVVEIFAEVSQKVLEEKTDGKSTDLIYGEFAHLMLGCHFDLYPSTRGYRSYDKNGKTAPIYYLAKKSPELKELSFTILNATFDILDKRSDDEIEKEAKERRRKDLERMHELGYRPATGTPFDLGKWEIKPPRTERN